jgi:hypothetical protein
MAEYQLTATGAVVIRTEDSASIPNDPANRDYAEYQQWLQDGGVPDPYVEPPPPPAPPPSPEDQVLFNHENRLRAIEGTPPLVLADFMKQKETAP